MNSGKSLLIILILFTILNSIAFAQDFRFGDIEALKREFMRGSQRAPRPQKTTVTKKKGSNSSEAEKKGAAKIKFPGAQELRERSDVAFIDPEKYILGPGDNLKIIIFGRLYEEQKVIIQPDGTIFLAPAGSIYIKGKTISQCNRRIHRIMKRYFRNFKLKVQLTKLRTIEVRILGEVVNPGTYIATPVIGACDVIGMAGGLKEKASLRNVALRNDRGRKIARIDLFSWYYMGDRNQNRLLNAKYQVFVPLMQQKVTLDGAFRRKGFIEIAPGDRLSDILKMAEPETGAVLSEGKLTRISPDGALEIIPVNLKNIIKGANKSGSREGNLLLAGGDTLFVPDMEIFLEKIRVIGELKDARYFISTINKLTGETEIQKVGLYNLKKGETVKDVIISLGGVTAKANMEKARVERPLGRGEVKVIPVNLRKLIYENDKSQNVTLREGDTLIVPPIPDTVYILGEIRAPGAYQYNVGNKIKEYIALAGGPTKKAKLRHVKVIKEKGGKMIVHTIDLRSILTGNKREEFELRPGDVIYLPFADIVSWRDVLGIITDLIVLRRIFDF